MAARVTSPPIGLRRVRFVLEAPVETLNTLGGAAIAYVALLTLWGRIEAHGGTEPAIAGRIEAVVDTRITLRWRAGIDAGMRLVLGGRRFAIRAVLDPDGTRKNLVCLCQEIVS